MSSLDNKSSKLRQDRQRVLLRSSSSPKLTEIPEKKTKPRSLSRSTSNANRPERRPERSEKRPERSERRPERSEKRLERSEKRPERSERCSVPRLELDLSRDSEYRQERGVRPSKRDEELSAEFLPTHDTASLRPVLSDQTQSELVLAVPTM